MNRIYTKDVGEVRDVYRRECGFVWQLEDGVKERFKMDMGVGV